MATTTVTTYTCDKCGREDDKVTTYTMPVAGRRYAVDLCAKDAKPFISAAALAQEYGHRLTAAGARYRTTILDSDPKAIRAWAASQGIRVPARGRLPREILERFRSTH